MHTPSSIRHRTLFTLAFGLYTLALLSLYSTVVRAEDILFFGNSFTAVNDVPKMVADIATARGKTAADTAVTKGGQGWAFHLAEPATDEALKSKPWNWVVLQDYSTNATHASRTKDPGDFTKNGQAFYDRIASESPASGIVLYETWAYAAKNPIFNATPAAPAVPATATTPAIPARNARPALFASPDEMYGEIHKNYAALQALLQAKDPRRKVLVAPVGTAFAKCAHDHPGINLYAPDFKHPNIEGSYLSSLVIYATIFNDDPLLAADIKKTDPAINKILREIAAAVLKK